MTGIDKTGIDKASRLTNTSRATQANSPSSAKRAVKNETSKSLNDSVVTSVAPEIKSEEADLLAKNLGESVQSDPSQALAAQGGGLDEDLVRSLLED